METLNRRGSRKLEPVISDNGKMPEVKIEKKEKVQEQPLKAEVVINKVVASPAHGIVVFIPSQYVEYREKMVAGKRTRWMHGNINSIPFEIECDVQFNLADASPNLTAEEVRGAIAGVLDYIRGK